MPDPKQPQGSQSETLHVSPDQVKIEPAGHITITDPKVAQLLKQKTGIGQGNLKADKLKIGVVVGESF